MSYDTKDRLISTNRDGRKAVFFQYDAQGTSLDATDMESQKKTVVTINDRSLPLTVEDISIRYDFDDDGNLHRIYMVNGEGDLTTFAFKYSQDIVPVEFRHVAYSPLLFCHIVDSNIGTLLSNFQFANMPQTCEVMLRTIHGDTESYTLSYRLEDNVLNTTLYRDVKDDNGQTANSLLQLFQIALSAGAGSDTGAFSSLQWRNGVLPWHNLITFSFINHHEYTTSAS